MSKKTFVKALVGMAEDLSAEDAGLLAEGLLHAVKAEMASKGYVRLPGIGTMRVVTRARREGSNPRTGQPYVTPERLAVRFKASPSFIAELNPGKRLPPSLARRSSLKEPRAKKPSASRGSHRSNGGGA